MAVSGAHSSLTALIDVKLGGVLLANMLAGWLEADPNYSAEEVTDEPEDYGTPSEQTCLHLPAPVDTRTSAPSSREHGAPICAARESAGAGLEPDGDPHSRPGSGNVGGTGNGAGRLQDPGSGCFDGSGGRGVCIGGLATSPLEFRLASIAGVMRVHRNAGDRRRWLLQPGRFQRRPSFGIEGHNGPSRTSFSARAPPGWQDSMGSPDAQPCVGSAQEPVLCGEVCLWPISVSP